MHALSIDQCDRTEPANSLVSDGLDKCLLTKDAEVVSPLLFSGATLSASTRGLDLYTLLYLPVLALWIAAVAASHFRPPAGTR